MVTQDDHKKRMVIDYTRTINKFTFVDSYPFPKMHDVVQKVARYKIYSRLDMSSAYHQVEILACDRMYTAFQAKGSLWQWKKIHFGWTNGVDCFQRIIDEIIKSDKCMGTYAYLDNIIVEGKTQEEYDANLANFLKVAKDCNLTLNKDKCVYSAECINLLGYQINRGFLNPDPKRVATLLKLSPPQNSKELQRVVGLFAYYAQWIGKYSDKIKPLINNSCFPLTGSALETFKFLKSKLADVPLGVIDEKEQFVVETDAS